MLTYFIHTVLLPLLPCMLGLLFNSCCCQGCIFIGLDFVSGAVSDNFTTVSGSWSIGSGVLSTSSSDAELSGLVANPNGDANTRVTCTVNIATSGDTAGIILDRQDANNYWFGEVKFGTGAYIRIYQRSGGTNTQIVSQSFTMGTGSRTVCASILQGNFVLTCGGRSLSAPGSFTNPGWGIRTGTLTGTVAFDDLSVATTSGECADEACKPDCSACMTSTGPPTILVTFPPGQLAQGFGGGPGHEWCSQADCDSVAGMYYLPPVSQAQNDSNTNNCGGTGACCPWGMCELRQCSIQPTSTYLAGWQVSIRQFISTSPPYFETLGHYYLDVHYVAGGQILNNVFCGGTPNDSSLWFKKDYGTSLPDCLSLSNEVIPGYGASNGHECTYVNFATLNVEVTSL